MRLSPDARRVVYVAGYGSHPPAPMVTVVLEDGRSVPIEAGHHPCWVTDSIIEWSPQEDGFVRAAMAAGDWEPLDVQLPAGNTLAAVRAVAAVHRTDPRRVILSNDRVILGATDPAISDDGVWLAYIRPDEPREGVSRLMVERVDGSIAPIVRWEGAPLAPRFGGTTLAFQVGGGAIAACADVANPAVGVTTFPLASAWSCSKPVPVWVPTRGELFILFIADAGEFGEIKLATWGSLAQGAPRGYAIGTSAGSAYDHDARPVGLDQVRVQWLDPAGLLDGLTVTLTGLRATLQPPAKPEPPVVPPVDPNRWALVPDGTVITHAMRALWGDKPSRSADGKRIYFAKNAPPQGEWREFDTDGTVYHLFDQSRGEDVPTGPRKGWYLTPRDACKWAKDTFTSGESFTVHGEKVEFDTGARVRWTHTITLYGLKAGGVMVRFDPRFPGMYEPAGYEHHYNRLDGGVRWEFLVTPKAAQGVIPWGDPSMDVLRQEAEDQAHPGQPTPAYVECPRLSVNDDPWAPKPPKPPEPPMGRQPNQAEIQNAFDRLHIEGYMHELQRAGGIFESPKTYAESRIRDERPGGTAYVDEAYVVHMTHYLDAFAGNGNQHDPAVRHMLQILHDSDEARQKRGETHQPPPVIPAGSIQPLHIDGTTFRRPDGTIWKYRAVTAFSAFQDFLNGRDLDPYAAWTRSVGGNAWRVFYTWKGTDFNPMRLGLSALRHELAAFRAYMDAQGLYGHHTVLCDQVDGSSVRLSSGEQDALLDAVVDSMQGQFIEVMNEAWQNGGNDLAARFPATRFAGTFASRSTWQDGETPAVVGSLLDFTSEHTPRDDQWPRKGKNLLETSVQGIGTYPATKRPAICGEPIGIWETDIPGSRTANASDVADYFAVAELFGAGACLHGDGSTLQRCNVPGPVAQQCAEWAHAARIVVPDYAQLGAYTRGGLDDCPLEHSDDMALRTFAMISGPAATAVVVRPVPGWQAKPRNGWTIKSISGPNGHVIALSR